MRTIFSLLVVLLFVVSCGGGDSVESPAEPPEPETMEPVESDPVEPEEPMEPEPSEPEVPEEPMEPEEPELIIPLGEPGVFDWDECLHTDKLVAFFDHIFEDQSQIERFNSRPMLSLAEGTTDFQADIVRRALEFINYSLPEEYRVSLENVRVPALSGEPPNGEIYVDFVSKDQWRDIEGLYAEEAIGVARYYSSFNEDDPELSGRSVHIWIDPQYIQTRTLEGNFYKNLRDTANIGLLAHEILHALGFSGHVPAERVGAITSSPVSTIMWPTVSAVGHSTITEETRILTGASSVSFGLLNPADRAGLRYLYEEIETGDDPRDITEAELDSWLTDKGCFSQ